jgi:perosamine synthetase
MPDATAHAFDADAIASKIVENLPVTGRVSLHEPRFGAQEKANVLDCVETGWVSYLGSYVDQFEKRMASLAGVGHGIATVNGTSALRVALQAMGIGTGDEVLVPDLTFIATLNAVCHLGATPHLIDSDRVTLGLCPDAMEARLAKVGRREKSGVINIETGQRIVAVMPMHVFGHPARMDEINQVAERWGLIVVEDAAQAIGSMYNGRPAGSLGRIAAFSFNGNKTITTGGGGAIVTDDADVAARIRHLTTQAKKPHPWAFEHDEIASNDRMPNLNAALGCGQLDRLDQMLTSKRRVYQNYAACLDGIEGIEMITDPPECVGNQWLVSVLTPGAVERDALLQATHDRGILARPAWVAMHAMAMFADCPKGPLEIATDLADRLVCLPSSPFLDPGWRDE